MGKIEFRPLCPMCGELVDLDDAYRFVDPACFMHKGCPEIVLHNKCHDRLQYWKIQADLYLGQYRTAIKDIREHMELMK